MKLCSTEIINNLITYYTNDKDKIKIAQHIIRGLENVKNIKTLKDYIDIEYEYKKLPPL